MIDLITGFFIAGMIASFAYFRQSLNRSGAIAAVIIGTIIYASGGALMMGVLLTFFISSNIIGRLAKIKRPPAMRNAKQVLANGGVATLLAIIYFLTQEEAYIILFIISIAVATADTWSSELGLLSKKAPISILTLQPTKYGVSGSVTGVGLFAALAGATLISAFASFQLIVILFGFFGSILDSVLGHFQVRYQDNVTKEIKEDPDKNQTDVYLSGIRFLTNGAVNFLSNLGTVLLAFWVV